jgi:ribosomal protein S12 methylthiotransferase accessory factor
VRRDLRDEVLSGARHPDNPARIGRIELDIEVPPEFPEKYHDAVIRAADGCAVKKAIMNPFEIGVRTVVRD